MRLLLIIFGLLVYQWASAAAISQISIVELNDQLRLSWSALGKRWQVVAERDEKLGTGIPVIEVAVRNGNERLLYNLPNRFYNGKLMDEPSKVFIDLSDKSVPFLGFVSVDRKIYLLEKDNNSATGIAMRLEITANDVGTDSLITENSGWGAGGNGGALTPTYLIPRNREVGQFPTLDIYMEPSYREQVGPDYVSRVMASLAVANIMYVQSGLKPIRLLALVLTDEEVSLTGSQGSTIHGLERIRKYTAAPDSADGSIIYTGGEFYMPGLWGWAEGGYACELQIAVAEDNPVNTHRVGQSAAANIDLPTLLQRGWILGHEYSHILGAIHIFEDPITYGSFQPQLALEDYVSTCAAKRYIFRSCRYDPQTKAILDFYCQ